MSEGFHIQSIAIGDGMIEVSYSEERDQSPHVVQVRTLAVNIAAVETEFLELVDSAQELVDAALLVHRSPDLVSRPGVTGPSLLDEVE